MTKDFVTERLKLKKAIYNEIAGTDFRLSQVSLRKMADLYFIGDNFVEDLGRFTEQYGKTIKDDILSIIRL